MAKLIAGATLVLALAALALPASAQSVDPARVDRLEKQLKELRSIVFQGRDTGQPVVVKPEGPDPAVQALQGRLDDLDATQRKTAGQVEVNQHDLDQTRQNASGNHDAVVELRAQIQALTDRLNRLEAGGAAAAQPQPDAQPQAQVAPPEPARPARKGDRNEATARAQAEDQGVLGGPPSDAAHDRNRNLQKGRDPAGGR